MLRRSGMYFLLAAFAGAMVLLLALDDPAAKSRSETVVALFPQLSRAEHLDRIEVQNVTEGTGVMLVRDGAGLWYAAQMLRPAQTLSADQLDQDAVNAIARSITRLAAEQVFEATPDNLARFGLRPQPVYTLQFAGNDAAGRAFESVVFEVGDANPDRVARYVWPRDGQQVYLLAVDFLLRILPVTPQPELASTSEPVAPTDAPPVP